MNSPLVPDRKGSNRSACGRKDDSRHGHAARGPSVLVSLAASSPSGPRAVRHAASIGTSCAFGASRSSHATTSSFCARESEHVEYTRAEDTSSAWLGSSNLHTRPFCVSLGRIVPKQNWLLPEAVPKQCALKPGHLLDFFGCQHSPFERRPTPLRRKLGHVLDRAIVRTLGIDQHSAVKAAHRRGQATEWRHVIGPARARACPLLCLAWSEG